MSVLWRYRQAGATFAHAFDSLQDLRQRFIVTGAPTISASPFGPVLTVDGANDYVTLSAAWEANLRFDSGAQDFSLVVWFRLGATGAVQTLVDKREAADDGYVLFVDASDNLQFSLDAIDVSGAATLVANIWYCGIITVDRSGNGQLYLNGATDGAAVAIGGEVMATTTAPRVGAESFGAAANKLDGQVASVVLIDRLLIATEAASIAAGQAWDYDRGLVSCYSMSDINPADECWRGLGNDGIGTGLVAATDIVDGIAGGKATQYNGADEHTTVTRHASLTTPQFTASCWAKVLGGVGNYRGVIANRFSTNTVGYVIYANNANNWEFWIANGTAWSQVTGPAATIGRWFHLAAMYDGTTARFFVNGTEVGTPAVVVYQANDGSDIFFGSGEVTGSPNFRFPGVVDTVRMYDAGLTPIQIRDLMIATRTGRV